MRAALACVSTACSPLPGAMPLAMSHRVFGTSTRSSPFWMPHTNERPPAGVHGAGGGACAQATTPLVSAPVIAAARKNCFMSVSPPRGAIVTETIEFRNVGRPCARGDDARRRGQRDRPGAHSRASVRRRPGGDRLLAPALLSAAAGAALAHHAERAVGHVALRAHGGRGVRARSRLLALRHRQ